ncbi:F-box protein SKIP17 [Raphanus sativus]|nr:F-box protein SKIP17 [Raphanus sativus]
MHAASCCTMFNKCAMDRFSYVHVDLTTATKQVESKVVCTMIHRAGKELRSLKLGSLDRPYPSLCDLYLVNGPFLSRLSRNPDFFGSRLKSLGLYNISSMNRSYSFEVLSVCSNLTDLRIVGLKMSSVRAPLHRGLSTPKQNFSVNPFLSLLFCLLLSFLKLTRCVTGTIDTVEGSHLIKFVTNSPNLTSLRLIRFRINDEVARILAQSSRTLEYLNLSDRQQSKVVF